MDLEALLDARANGAPLPTVPVAPAPSAPTTNTPAPSEQDTLSALLNARANGKPIPIGTQAAGKPTQAKPSGPVTALGALEAAGTVLSGIVAEPVAGWAGILTGNPDNVEATRRAMTYQPRTDGGNAALGAVGDFMQGAKRVMVDENPPVKMAVDAFNAAADKAGEVSPVLGAAIKTVPTAATIFAGPGSSVARNAVRSVARDVASVPGKAAGRVANQAAEAVSINPAASGRSVQGAQTAAGAAVEATPEVPQFASPANTAPANGAQFQPTGTPRFSTLEQQNRIDTLRAIGLDEQRPSTYSGDNFRGAQEWQTSKLDTPTGKILREQFEKEQAAIKGFADSIVESTGGMPGADAVSRGTAITAPMQALSEHFDRRISALYAAADQASGGAPNIQLSGFNNLMNTNSVFAGKMENSALRRGIRAYMKEQGITADGSLQPINAQAAEGLRQYLNSQWSPQNSGLIGKIKEALDLDVTQAAGKDAYESARNLHMERKNTLDNPKGIAGILQEEGPNGINRQVPLEQVAVKTVNMPVAQFKHVIDTLKKMPTPEMQHQADQALNEIRRQMAETVYAAGAGKGNGPWNASSVTRTLNALRPKLNLVFSEEELKQLRTLNDAGHILATDRSYPGAAAQGYNMMQNGAIKGAPWVGTAVGTVMGSPATGYVSGKAASAAVQGWADKSQAAKLAEMLRKPTPQK